MKRLLFTILAILLLKIYADAQTLPPCNIPTGLTVSSITYTNATAAWNANPNINYYDIRWREFGSLNWNYETTVITNRTLVGLFPCNMYEVQIQSHCVGSLTDSSGYSNSVFFTTLTSTGPPASIPTLTTNNSTYCVGSTDSILINGNLNGASFWEYYTNFDTTKYAVIGNSFPFNINVPTKFYVRGFGYCNNTTGQYDSIFVNPQISSTYNIIDTVCSSSLPYVLNAVPYNTTGVYSQLFTNAAGCDSIVKLYLTVLPFSQSNTSYINYNQLVCQNSNGINFQWTFNGSPIGLNDSILNVTQPGQYYVTYTNIYGCVGNDSFYISACNAPNGIIISNITHTTANVTWNSIVGATGYQIRWRQVGTLNWNNATTSTNARTLDSLQPCNILYEVQVSSMCNNILLFSPSVYFNTLGITGPPASTPTLTTNNSIYCVGNTDSILINGNLNGSNFWEYYTNFDTTEYAVNGNSFPYSITMPTIFYVRGFGYCNNSGFYDSILINVAFPNTGFQNAEICASQTPYVWNAVSYYNQGNYLDTFTNVSGCDSVVTLNLIIHPTPNPTIIFNNGQLICNNISINNFQWFLNNNPVGTNDSVLQINQNGTYSIIVTDIYGCTGSNTYTVSALSNSDFSIKSKPFSIFPNPSNNILNIHSSSAEKYKLKLVDVLGKIIIEKNVINSSKELLNIEQINIGNYSIIIETEKDVYIYKFQKE